MNTRVQCLQRREEGLRYRGAAVKVAVSCLSGVLGTLLFCKNKHKHGEPPLQSPQFLEL